MSLDSPRVESFVLRFVQDAPENDAPVDAQAWRGIIVHVQTNEEKTFTHFADAVAFIARHVPVGDFSFNATKDEGPKTDAACVRPSSSVLNQSGE